MLKQISEEGMFVTLEKGIFANTKRPINGGKGLDGTFKKHEQYVNVVLDRMEESFNED